MQLSSNGIPYIFHDNDLKRLFGKNIIFNSLNSDEIDELILFDKYKIPTLESTLQKFPDTLFQIDVKTDEVVLPTMEVIKKTNSTDKVCIASFSSKRLKQVQTLP